MSMSEKYNSLSGWSAEINYFRLALGFFSRIPMGKSVVYRPEFMHTCTRYFPLVGWLLALLLAGAYSIAAPLFGVAVAVALVVVSSVLLTGALHEDGLADTCDGFWGGLTIERKIDIMKDSRIGTYGACGLILALGLKTVLLHSLAQFDAVVLALFLAYPLSRAMALTHVQDLPYVSHLGSVQKNKSDPLARPVSVQHLVVVLVSGALATLALPVDAILSIAITVIVVRYALKRWMRHHIGGFTGDVLGAAQQIQELVIYLVLLAWCRGGI